jgi:hypothetical protein
MGHVLKSVTIVLALLGLVGCTMLSAGQGDPAGQVVASPTPATRPTARPSTGGGAYPPTPAPEQGYGAAQYVVERAIADLRGRLDIRVEQVTVQEVVHTEFPDASLGVPKPDTVYAQVVTPGYVIRLAAEDKVYEYHGSGDRVVLAPDPGGPPVPPLPDQDTHHRVDIPLQILPHSLTWDPSGRWLAYAGNDGRVWLRERGSEAAQMVQDLGSFAQADLWLSWSPDGSHLLIYGEWGLEHPRWTGLWLMPVSDGNAGSPQSVVAPLKASSPVQQNEGAISSAAWSADGGRVAYVLGAEAWVYHLASGRSERVTNLTARPLAQAGATDPFDGIREVAWSPDGRSLALGLSCNCPSPWGGVGIVDLDGRTMRLLVDGGHDVGWSADGRWITFRNAAGDWTGGSTFDYYGVTPLDGQITNLTRSNPGWDPLHPAEGAYRDANYQTANLRWGPEGRFLFETLDYVTASSVAPQWGFVAKAGPETVLETHLGDVETWRVFPAWLADGRLAYLEAEASASTSNAFAVQRAVIGQQAVPLEQAYVHGAAWASNGSAVALCVADGPTLLSDRVTISLLRVDDRG